jgi:hypothetical protein
MLTNPGEKFHDPHEAERLARVWHEDMIWWGPAGSARPTRSPATSASMCCPFDDALSQGYRFNGHICRLAEGHFGGFFGWANLTLGTRAATWA